MFISIIKFFLPSISLIIYFYLLFFILRKSNSRIKYYFILVLTSGVIWLLTFYLENIYLISIVNYLLYIDFISAAFVGYFIVLFFLALLNKANFFNNVLLLIPTITAILLTFFKIFNFQNGDLISYNKVYYLLYFCIIFFEILILTTILIYKIFLIKNGLERLQLKYIALGYYLSVIPILFASFFEIIFDSNFNNNTITTVILVNFAIIFPILTTYAITRYRFMNIYIAIQRGFNYFLTNIICVIIISLLISFIFNKIIIYKFNITLVITFLIAFMLVLIDPLKKTLLLFFDKFLFTSKENKYLVNSNKLKLNAQKIFINKKAIIHIEELVNNIIVNNLFFINNKEIKLLTYDQTTKLFECIYPNHKVFSLSIDDPVFLYLNAFPEIIVAEEIPYILSNKEEKNRNQLKAVYKFMKKNKVEIILPIGNRDSIFGIFLLGKKYNNSIYTKEEIDMIINCQNDYTPLLINTIMYKEAIERIKI